MFLILLKAPVCQLASAMKIMKVFGMIPQANSHNKTEQKRSGKKSQEK